LPNTTLTFQINTHGRDFAVSDIQGSFSVLQIALDAIEFNPEVDRLFSVGDLVDRGPESHLVLDWLDKPWFHAICGNHDFMAWRSAVGNPYPCVNHRQHGGAWLDELEIDVRLEIGRRLAELPLVIEVQTPNGLIGIVHAQCPHDDWELISKNRASEEDIDCFLWSTERYQQKISSPICNVHAVVHCHMTVSNMVVLGNTYYIDTGGWTDRGHFTLLNLHDMQPFSGPGDDCFPFDRRMYR
jgi:serine/threonine protein phosphatase 1